MSRVGRNEACPCGSGKKSKRCCGDKPAEEGGLQAASELHALDEVLVSGVFRYARQRFDGWNPFEEYPGERSDLHNQIVVPWGAYIYAFEGLSTLEHMLVGGGDLLPPKVRRFAEAQTRTWLSCWEVLHVDAGAGLRLRDLLSGEERYVHERAGSRTLAQFEVVLGRVVELDGTAVLCGLHPIPLSPREGRAVELTVRNFSELGDDPIAPEVLGDAEIAKVLILAWDRVAEERSRAQAPKLTNTDGEPLVMNEDCFDLIAGARAKVLSKVLGLPGAEAEENEDGNHKADRVAFIRAGNAMHASWDNTVVGRARLSKAELVLETNSVERADALRAAVETACAGLLKHRRRVQKEGAELMKSAGAMPPRGPRPDPGPEVRAALRDMKEAHYRAWLDQPIPALRGKTPRQAVRSRALKPELELLLKEIAQSESRLDPGERFDVSCIYRDLGLEGGEFRPPVPTTLSTLERPIKG